MPISTDRSHINNTANAAGHTRAHRRPALPRPLIILAAFLLGLCTTEPVAAAGKPNIVLIMADDLDATTSEYWERATNAGKDDPLKKTRALIRNQGVTFTNAFAPNPICCPSRASLLTGRFGHNTGVLTNSGDQGGRGTFVNRGGEAHSLAPWLRNAGYRTAIVGKYLNGIDHTPTEIPPGWTDWFVFVDNFVNEYKGYGYNVNENGVVSHRGWNEEDYSTDYVRARSLAFIEQASASGEPFFLYVSATAPHLPLPPAKRHLINPYALAPLPRRPNTHELDMSDKPMWLASTSIQRSVESIAWSPIDYRLRQGSLYALDELVEAVVKKLEKTGELDNTYIVFLSDNGYNLGAHNLIHKMAPYEESIRIPWAVRGPGIPAGISKNQIVVMPDFAPTVLEWAGISNPVSLQGVPSPERDGASLVPLLKTSSPATWRKDFTIQYASRGFINGVGAELPPAVWNFSGMDIPSYLAIREDNYKLIKWDATLGTQWELYDLKNDPHEMHNLLANPLNWVFRKPTIERLKNRMQELSNCEGASCRNW
jgi:N-acetylglucosamine-6-sulfatase